jgi:peptidoglycan-associated lipoprotein
MKQSIVKLFLVLCCGAFLVSGCSCLKEETMKEEPMAPPPQAVEAPAAAPVVAEPAAPVVQEETLQEPVAAVAQEAALQSVYFGFDSYVLSAEARDTLKNNAAVINTMTSTIQVQGHCDERGSAEYNLALGEKRAKAAMKYLKTLGVPGDRLTFISFGKEKPLDPGHNEAAWAKNRRADLVEMK